MKNNHLILCWEIGGNRGHIYQFAKLAKKLIEQGYKVSVILKDLSHFSEAFKEMPVRCYQSPLQINPIVKPINHADILHNHGYNTAPTLINLIIAWRNLFYSLKPDCIICEAAPTAYLAAQIDNISAISIDNGFFCPPQTDPLEALRSWEPVEVEILRKKEIRTLEVINSSLNHFNHKPFHRFCDVLDKHALYLTWPEMSHFGKATDGRYLGPLHKASSVRPRSREIKKKNCVIYLTRCTNESRRIVNWATNTFEKNIAFLPNWPQQEIERLSAAENFFISDGPLDLSLEFNDAAVFISHGGAGSVAEAIDHGVVPLLCPNHVEQYRLYLSLLKHGLTISHTQNVSLRIDNNIYENVRVNIEKRRVATKKAPDAICSILIEIQNKLIG